MVLLSFTPGGKYGGNAITLTLTLRTYHNLNNIKSYFLTYILTCSFIITLYLNFPSGVNQLTLIDFFFLNFTVTSYIFPFIRFRCQFMLFTTYYPNLPSHNLPYVVAFGTLANRLFRPTDTIHHIFFCFFVLHIRDISLRF